MSKMGNEFLRQSEAASLDNAAELARLRDVFARARALLSEGDPAGVLEERAGRLRRMDYWLDSAKALEIIAGDIRRVVAMLAD